MFTHWGAGIHQCSFIKGETGGASAVSATSVHREVREGFQEEGLPDAASCARGLERMLTGEQHVA